MPDTFGGVVHLQAGGEAACDAPAVADAEGHIGDVVTLPRAERLVDGAHVDLA